MSPVLYLSIIQSVVCSLGNALLVKPVTEEHAKVTEVYFPGGNSEVKFSLWVNGFMSSKVVMFLQTWHDITNLQIFKGGSKATIDTPLQKVRIFLNAIFYLQF